MSSLSTPIDVLGVMNCAGMSLKEIRIARLKAFAAMKEAPGPVELGKLIGRKTNQTSDLLTGKASFGEKLARSIEAFAGLPDRWLDVERGELAYWPFSEELQQVVSRLDAQSTARLEAVMRATLGLSQIATVAIDTPQAPGQAGAILSSTTQGAADSAGSRGLSVVQSAALPKTPALDAEDARHQRRKSDQQRRQTDPGSSRKPENSGNSH